MRALFVSYNGALDSLGQSQILPYLKEIRKDGHEITLLTFERVAHTVPERVRDLCASLNAAGIRWVWLRYHKRPPVLSTLWDVACGIVVSVWLVLRRRVDALHARSQVSAAMAWPVTRLLRKRFIFDLRGQMAYEYVDGGAWAAGGLLFRLAERAERRFVRDSDALVVLTRVLAGDIAPLAPCRPVVIPTCVDLDLFPRPPVLEPAEPARIVYCGSLGARYALSLLVTCFVEARARFPGLRFQVLTHSDPEGLRKRLDGAGIPGAEYEIQEARHRDIPRYLAQALFGVLLLQGGRSLRGACPTKVGEYLAAGLPVLCSPGIGDCLEQLEGNRVGVVLKDHRPESFREGLCRLADLLEEGGTVRERCRLIAEQEFSLSGRGGPAYRALYRNLEGGR